MRAACLALPVLCACGLLAAAVAGGAIDHVIAAEDGISRPVAVLSLGPYARTRVGGAKARVWQKGVEEGLGDMCGRYGGGGLQRKGAT